MNVVTWPPPISRSVVGARGFCRVWLDAYEVVSWAGAEHNMVDLRPFWLKPVLTHQRLSMAHA